VAETTKRVGAEISVEEYWGRVGARYAATIDGGYHRHRLEVISALLPDLVGKTVVDFGCGEGVLMRQAIELGRVRSLASTSMNNYWRKRRAVFS
jgi:2-polyprenyl-3-methyl-5-hydroxy-6-metoxy-1,4-benzoquinol methylase